MIHLMEDRSQCVNEYVLWGLTVPGFAQKS